jgi:hypothetical protein
MAALEAHIVVELCESRQAVPPPMGVGDNQANRCAGEYVQSSAHWAPRGIETSRGAPREWLAHQRTPRRYPSRAACAKRKSLFPKRPQSCLRLFLERESGPSNSRSLKAGRQLDPATAGRYAKSPQNAAPPGAVTYHFERAQPAPPSLFSTFSFPLTNPFPSSCRRRSAVIYPTPIT